MAATEPTAGSDAAQAGAEAYNPGESIMSHILDHDTLHVPFSHIHLPLQPFGYDLGITQHIVMMWIACVALVVIFRMAARSINEPVPSGLRNALETLIVYIRDEIARKAIDVGPDRFVGYLLTTFFFILGCNLLGMIPIFSTATGNISVTAALALIAFFMIQFGGIRENGLIQHFKNLVPHGLPVWLVPIMFFLEILSALIKPFALCIRLFANMMAGHVVILAFISLIAILGIVAAPVAVAFALFVHFLELLVAFLQAYIFTVLTAQFIGMSVHPAH